MKNILITALYKVGEMYGTTKYQDYQEMNQLCVKSFQDNLVGLDTVITLTGKVDDYHKLFEEIYWRIKEIYFENHPCNILWSDSDNICLKPLDIFGKFDDFAMFQAIEQFRTAYNNPECLKLTENLSPWFMANLRYYADDAPTCIWDTGDNCVDNWIKEWAYECIIYNKMIHCQYTKDFNSWIHPEWNVQAEGDVNSLDPVIIRNAVVLHCHSTRGSHLVVPKMKRALEIVKEDY